MNKTRVEKALDFTHQMTLSKVDNLYYKRKTDLNSLAVGKKRKEEKELAHLLQVYSCLEQKNAQQE